MSKTVHRQKQSANAYANEICELLEAQNVRVDLDDRAEKLGYRMREYNWKNLNEDVYAYLMDILLK